MKSHPESPPRPWRKTRDRLQAAIILNQLATPGLGSWIAGHRGAGAGQLTLACVGFGMFVVYFVRLMMESWQTVETGLDLQLPWAGWWRWGLLVFGVAWAWAGVTSVQIGCRLRSLQPDPEPTELPPRL